MYTQMGGHLRAKDRVERHESIKILTFYNYVRDTYLTMDPET